MAHRMSSGGATSRILPPQPMHAHVQHGGAHEKKRRRRTRPHEVNILMSAYVRNAFPSEKTRAELASMVGMSTRAVSVWFQNRRQAEKKRSMRYQATHSATLPHHVATVMSTSSIDAATTFPPRELFARSQSTPSVSLMTTSGGRAALSECPAAALSEQPARIASCTRTLSCTLDSTNDGHGIITGGAYNDDRAIWQRMESSSALGSGSSEADNDMPPLGTHGPSEEDDDEERTLRRLAQRRLERVRERKRALSHDDAKRHASDARLVIQEHKDKRRSRSFQRKPSLRLEMAADGDMFADKENAPPFKCSGAQMQRIHSEPLGAMQKLAIHAQPTSTVPTGSVQSQGTPLMPRRPLGRRVVSASTTTSTTQVPCKPMYWTPTSSARSNSDMQLVQVTPPEGKVDAQDDSGFFDDAEQASMCSLPEAGQPKHVLDMLHGDAHTSHNPGPDTDAWTEHDRQAAELLLGLGGGHVSMRKAHQLGQ